MKKLSPSLMCALRSASLGETIAYSIAKTLEVKGLVNRDSDGDSMWKVTKQGKEALKTEQQGEQK